ncbi:hypothetical protein ZWY2020_050690 [Hordeum vulgare]|nr:hypothetical protein ZWY2020_050690 [Hordeum vulgare]
MKHLPLMLDGSARAWLNQLAPSSIYSWADLARVFIRTFEGTCKRPAGLVELQHCVQKQNKPLRDFIQRRTTLYHTVENVTEHQAVCAFKAGVRYRDLYLKFGRTGDISMSKMMEIAVRYANDEEEDRIRSGKHKSVADGDGSNTWKQKQKSQSTPQAEAATVTNAKFKGKGKAQYAPQEEAVRKFHPRSTVSNPHKDGGRRQCHIAEACHSAVSPPEPRIRQRTAE